VARAAVAASTVICALRDAPRAAATANGAPPSSGLPATATLGDSGEAGACGDGAPPGASAAGASPAPARLCCIAAGSSCRRRAQGQRVCAGHQRKELRGAPHGSDAKPRARKEMEDGNAASSV